MKYLLVGDPHVTVEELDDCQALLNHVLEVALKERPQYIVFLGDQHHTHAVARVEVLDFWDRNLKMLDDNRQAVIFLTGNHDRSHNVNLKANTLVYDPALVSVVDDMQCLDGVAFVAWCPTNDEFLGKVGGFEGTVICHQTFDGSRYENGFYAPGGIDANAMKAKNIISGHIHTPQEFGKVWYPGAPRWRTASDANTPRKIWMVEVDGDGNIIDKTSYRMEGNCRAMYHFDDFEGGMEPTIGIIQQPAVVSVNIHGSAEYILARKLAYEAAGHRVATFLKQAATAAVKESDGISAALAKHVDAYKPKLPVPLDDLKKKAMKISV